MTLPPAVRQQIADALESATVETLREDAAALLDGDWSGLNTYRLAGLALAVGEMQERAQKDAQNYPDWYTGRYSGEARWGHESSPAVARTLPAALAHLLREGA